MNFTLTDPWNPWYDIFIILTLPLAILAILGVAYAIKIKIKKINLLMLTIVSIIFALLGLAISYSIDCCGVSRVIAGFPVPFFTTEWVDLLGDGGSLNFLERINMLSLLGNSVFFFNVILWVQIFIFRVKYRR